MNSGSGTTPTYTVSIRSDSSNSPGTGLTLVQQGSLPSTAGLVRFNAPGSGIDLDADTRYWLVVDVSTTNSAFKVNTTNSDAEDSGAFATGSPARHATAHGWSIADTRLSRNAGSTSWSGATTSSDALVLAIYGQQKINDAPTVSGAMFESASYADSVITVNFKQPIKGCADKIAWSFKVDGGPRRFPLAVRCKSQSVEIVLDALSQVPQVEAARSVTVSYHRGDARSEARSTPFCHPPRGCRPIGNVLVVTGSGGPEEVASFTDQPVSGLKPRLESATVDGATLTLTFDETLDAGSLPVRGAFHVTVNNARRLVSAGGVAIAGKTVRLTLESAVATGDTVKVRYNGSLGGLRGANRLRVDSFPDQAVTVLTSREIWSATLTVNDVIGILGCSDEVGSNPCSSGLTSNSFGNAEDPTRVSTVVLFKGEGARPLQLDLSKAISSSWTLHVGNLQFPVADATLSNSGTRAVWTNTGLNWGIGQQVSLRLTEGSGTFSAAIGPDSEPQQSVAASVAGVEVGSDAGADQTYGLGDIIQVRVGFSNTVDVTGTPRLKIDMDPANWGEKWAAYTSGSGTTTLTFAHTVVEPNISTQGIAVLANTLELNGGTIRTSGEDADLAHTGRDHDANHKVDWRIDPDDGAVGTGGPDGTTGNSGPPTVTGVKVVSDPGVDDTYMLGDTIRIRATFSEAVNVTGSPRISIDMSPEAWGTKQAAYASGSGAASLDFTYTVVEPNYSPQGIAVLANSLALNGGTIRSAATNANAELAHTKRDHDSGHKVDWRPEVSAADASAREGTDANAAFTVSLSRAFTTAGHTVTVAYATSDGTATAGADYTATSGTLTFAAGDTTKTVNVPILDDSHDEGKETFTLRLSNASGARIGDGEATGTIENADLMPAALLARFGRATAEQVVEQVEERMAAPREGGFRARLAGREYQPGMEGDFALGFLSSFAPMNTGAAAGAGLGAAPATGSHLAGAFGADTSGTGGAADLTGRQQPGAAGGGGLFGALAPGGDLLSSSGFELNRASHGGMLSLWSRSSRSYFTGMEEALSLDGDVRTTMFGADWARGPLTVGLSVGHTRALGGYAGASGGAMTTAMTGFYPWVGYQVNDRVSVWAVTGYGKGALTLTPDGAGELETGMSMAMTAVGTRGDLLGSRATGGFGLAFKADALWVGATTELLDGPTGRLNASEAGATRMRTALEGSRGFTLGDGRLSLRPTVEVGVRRDGGDAETGAGLDVGGGLAVADAAMGLSLDVRVRTLLVHQAEGFAERGLSVSFGWDPTPSSPFGLSARLAPSWGGSAMGGAEALWNGQMAYGPGSPGALGTGGQFNAEVGYGLPVGARFVGTPRVGLRRSAYGREYRAGWGLGVLDSSFLHFDLGLEAQRREAPTHGGASNGLLARATVSW